MGEIVGCRQDEEKVIALSAALAIDLVELALVAQSVRCWERWQARESVVFR